MVRGLFLAARGPKSPRFSSECPYFGQRGANMGPKIKIAARKRLNTRPKFVVTMSPAQAQQPEGVGTLRGPPGLPKGTFCAKTGPFGAPGGHEEAHYQAKMCDNHDSNPVGPICGNWDQIWPLNPAPRAFLPVRACLRPKGPFGAPVITYKVPERANMTYNHVSYPWVVF